VIEQQIIRMVEARRQAVARLPWCDAGLWLGAPEGFPLAEELRLDALLDQAKTCGIRGGLVSHWLGKTVSPQVGNAALEVAALPPGCFAVLTGLPLTPGEAGPLPGSAPPPPWVKGVRIFPRAHEFPLTPWCLRGLCSWLTAHALPLFIWHTELQWSDLHSVARAFPQLAIVVESQPLKIIYHVRALWAVMQECPNISVEISNLANGALTWMASHFGSQRFVFGSFLPANDPLVPMGMVIDSGLSETDQALIAGGNLRRLIGEAAR